MLWADQDSRDPKSLPRSLPGKRPLSLSGTSRRGSNGSVLFPEMSGCSSFRRTTVTNHQGRCTYVHGPFCILDYFLYFAKISASISSLSPPYVKYESCFKLSATTCFPTGAGGALTLNPFTVFPPTSIFA